MKMKKSSFKIWDLKVLKYNISVRNNEAGVCINVKYSYIKHHGNNLKNTLHDKQYVFDISHKFLNIAFTIFIQNFHKTMQSRYWWLNTMPSSRIFNRWEKTIKMCVRDVIIGWICKLKLVSVLSSFVFFFFWAIPQNRYLVINFWENIYKKNILEVSLTRINSKYIIYGYWWFVYFF